MIRRNLVIAIALASLLPAGLAHAVGLGQVELESALNQPLDANIQLINVGDLDPDQVFIKLASKEDFDRAGVDREYFLTKINFDVVIDKKTGRSYVHLKTRDRVQEPFLNFVVEARWPTGRVLREYTLLLDLPVTQGKAMAVSRPAALSATREATQPKSAPKAVTSTAKVESSQASASAAARPAVDRMASPVSSGSYRIQQGDSLWNIAKNHKPGSDASVQQTMLAIQSMNPQAFYKDNINLIKAGYVLRLPDAGAVQQLTYEEAVQEVAAQNQAWREGTDRPLPSKVSAAADATPVAPVAEPEGRLELSASGDAAAVAEGAADQAVAEEAEAVVAEVAVEAVEENLAAAEEQNAELQDKLEVMEDQVKTMERLTELKDQQMAALQEESAKPKAAPARQEAETGLSSSLMMSIGGGLLALLAIVAFLVTRRKKGGVSASVLPQQPVLVARTGTMPPVSAEAETEEVDVTDDVDAFDDADELGDVADDIATATTEPVEEDAADDEAVDATVTGMNAIPAAPTEAQTGDVVGEADIYMSLGRHAQAVSMLKGAIEKEPSNMKLHLKLLEVYVDSKNRDAFHKHFVQLQGTANAQTIGRAKELLLGVDDAPEWLGEKRNTQEMPTVTMPEIDDDMLATEDDALLAVNDEVPVENEGDTREMGIVELEDTGDFDFSSFGAKEAEKAADDEPETIDLGVSDDLDFLAGTDESGTKLDLARAYIDMGDIDGAKEILQEVIQDGNSGAKDEARKLLDSI